MTNKKWMTGLLVFTLLTVAAPRGGVGSLELGVGSEASAGRGRLRDAFRAAVSSVTGSIQQAAQGVGHAAHGVGHAIVRGAQQVGAAIQQGIQAIGGMVGDLVGDVADAVKAYKNGYEDAPKGIRGLAKYTLSKISLSHLFPENSDFGQLIRAFEAIPSDKGTALLGWAKARFKEAFDKLISIFPGLEKIKEFIDAIKSCKNQGPDGEPGPDCQKEKIYSSMDNANEFTSTLMKPLFLLMGPGAIVPTLLKSMTFKLLAELMVHRKLKPAAAATLEKFKAAAHAFKDKVKSAFVRFKSIFMCPEKEGEEDADEPEPTDAEQAGPTAPAPHCGSATFAELKTNVKTASEQIGDDVVDGIKILNAAMGLKEGSDTKFMEDRIKDVVKGIVFTTALPLGAVYIMTRNVTSKVITLTILGAEKLGAATGAGDESGAEDEVKDDHKSAFQNFMSKVLKVGTPIVEKLITRFMNSDSPKGRKLRAILMRAANVAEKASSGMNKVTAAAAALKGDSLEAVDGAMAQDDSGETTDAPAAPVAAPGNKKNPLVRGLMSVVKEELRELLDPRIQKLLDKLLRAIDNIMEIPRNALVASIGSIPFAGGALSAGLNFGLGQLVGMIKQGISKTVFRVVHEILGSVMADVTKQVENNLRDKKTEHASAFISGLSKILAQFSASVKAKKTDGGPNICETLAPIASAAVEKFVARGISDPSLRRLIGSGLGSLAAKVCKPGFKVTTAAKEMLSELARPLSIVITTPLGRNRVRPIIAGFIVKKLQGSASQHMKHPHGVIAGALSSLIRENKAKLAEALGQAGGSVGADVEKALEELAAEIDSEGVGAVLPPKKFARKLVAIGKAQVKGAVDAVKGAVDTVKGAVGNIKGAVGAAAKGE